MAAMFKALGDPTRLRIFEFLRGCVGPVAVGESGEVRRVTAGETSPQPSPWKGEGVRGSALPMVAVASRANANGVDAPRVSSDGVTVGEICCRITGEDRISSAISFHLKELRLAGLIQMERRGKNMICSVNPEAVTILADYFANGSVDGECC